MTFFKGDLSQMIVPIGGVLRDAMEAIDRGTRQIALVTDASGVLVGVITDGDIRRKLLRVQKPFSAFFVDDALDHAILSPLTIAPGDTLVHAVHLMDEKHIWDLPVVDAAGVLVGLLHLHPAVEALLGIDD